jgi:Cu(I)/Ag(I) efflux system membrane fusion protein
MSRVSLHVMAALSALLLTGCAREPAGEAPSDHAGGHGEHAGAAHAPAAGVAVAGMADVDVPSDRRQSIGLRTAVLARRPLVARLRTAGLVAPDERRVRNIQTKVSGWVDQLFVSFTGAAVRAGDPILSIYSPELVAAQREYLLAYQATRTGPAEVAGDRRLLLESARNRLRYWDVTDAQIDALARSGRPQRSVTLHSPIAGYVTIKPVYQGMYVTPEMELYQVSDLSTVWIWAEVYETEIGLVTVGETATITLPSAPGRPRRASVSYVSPVVESATRTLRVRFDEDNGDGQLRPGMYATVELESPLGEVLAVPEEAVIDTGERRVLFVEVAEGRFQPREVTLGRKGEGHYEALGGVAAGERVVVSAQFLLDSESRLRAAAGGPAHGGH